MNTALQPSPKAVGCRPAWIEWGPALMAAALLGLPGLLRGADRVPAWQERVEADWIVAERLALLDSTSKSVSTQADAAGGCDGIKDGGWGFHTSETENPWWQVDLGAEHSLALVVVWNRPQASERATNLILSVSVDGRDWQTVYRHDGSVFVGFTDQRPLRVSLDGRNARFVRVHLPGKTFLHLEEVEVFGREDPDRNLALHRPADQSSVSEWSQDHRPPAQPDWNDCAARALARVRRLEAEGWSQAPRPESEPIPSGIASGDTPQRDALGNFIEARARQRKLALRNPLLDFETLLFVKRLPSSFSHMSDQYYGWWSKPGGGIYLLRGFTGDHPREECLTTSFTAPGSFLRPTLSYDGTKVLFAWCRHYPSLAAESNKLEKARVPEDAFYHLYEMNIDGTGVRQLTRGKYDDFDGRYLPDGRIVFLSTRRGQALQAGRETAARTESTPDLPDCYVRCGGGPERPVAVYTLHTMNADGSSMNAISPFEMFEWTPEIASDGSILYSRWDYIDRDNMPYMGLWSMHPDGTHPRVVFKNYTKAPHCVFEAKPIPGSHRLIFTASAHHAQTMGSLAMIDPAAGLEGQTPITRLTPEVPFPEIEGWPLTYYANPWPLSERFHLVAWGFEGAQVSGPQGWNRWHAVQRPDDGMALYLYDAALGTRELLWKDPTIACVDPIPVRPRARPPVLATTVPTAETKEGRFLLVDVHQGLGSTHADTVRALRIVAVPAKTHPTMNRPPLGITADDPGKCVLGTVPVEPDGSAYFRAPAGVILFFQALDERGLAVQTMRSVAHVQAGQTLGCVGCHEDRQQAPSSRTILASQRPPSKIRPGPDGSWPLRFDRLVQPVVEARCVSCHQPGAKDEQAAKFDLTRDRAYDALVGFGKPSLRDQVWTAYRRGSSIAGDGIATRSALLALLEGPEGHAGVRLTRDEYDRIVTWMDTYAQRLGHFDDAQESELLQLRQAWAEFLDDPQSQQTAASTVGR
ncbi:MAG: discoidin domain-containing protein [Verrucomicrobiales bacterium]|nr:discoidin domain-containing protein [Verrucomicrobiales bacterium]